MDLVYLDPPFSSDRNYSAFFEEKDGTRAAAQIQAFTDTWTWDTTAVAAFRESHHLDNDRLARTMDGFEGMLGHCDMLAYLSMMAPRLHALKGVMKPTASIYLHCDPTASHFLKILMDAVFGPGNFRNEIIWKRSSAHNDSKQGASTCGRIHDTILFYTKSDEWIWNRVGTAHDKRYIDNNYRYAEGPHGQVVTLKKLKGGGRAEPPPGWRRFRGGDLTAAKPGGDTSYLWKGKPPYQGRFWAYSKENMEQFERDGRLVYNGNGMPEYKRYLDEMEEVGVSLQDLWTDIGPAAGREQLPYPTQKPLALLQRIIRASSPEDGVVLDPFCGCGTAVDAAQDLGRRWIGIDISHVAMKVIKDRMEDRYGTQIRDTYDVFGIPKTIREAEALAAENRFKFQDWALTFLTGARPNAMGASPGADRGKDGTRILDLPNGKFLRVLIQVKSGHVHRDMVSTLIGDMSNQNYQMGVLVTLEEPTREMRVEALDAGEWAPEDPLGGGVDHFPKVQLVTVGELLEGKKLAFPDYHESTLPKTAPAPKRKPIKKTRKLGEYTEAQAK